MKYLLPECDQGDYYSVKAVKSDLYQRLGCKLEAENFFKRLLSKIDNKAVKEFIAKCISEIHRI